MIRKVVLLAFLLTLCVAVSAQARATIDADLIHVLSQAGPNDQINVYVVLKEQLDLRAALAELDSLGGGRARRHFEIVTRLQDLAERSQAGLVDFAEIAAEDGTVTRFYPFWISNSIAVSATPAFIRELAEQPEVAKIYWDAPIELIGPVDGVKMVSSQGDGVENGVAVIGAPDLWALGIDGTGTIACDQDTGADGSHVAFASRWRGLDPGVTPAEAWFDPNYNETFPTDACPYGNCHGTHTLGTIVGDDGGSNQIGVAPGAKWIGAKTIDVGDILTLAVAAFEWAADPDGEPGTIDDVPHVVSNSWGLPQSLYGQCQDDFNTVIDACEAAGVAVVFAAGNEGSTGPRSPGDRIASDVNVFSVGALEQDGETIAYFSSLGPSRCDNTTIKPEVSAVGVDVRSAQPGNSYGLMSGTSMATPHVAGAILLLASAYPDATPEQLKTALYVTAIDLGPAGEDNTFGNGRIDLVAALAWLMEQMVNSDGKVRVDSTSYNCDDTITITVSDIDLTAGTQNVTIVSNTETTPETVTLAQTDTAGVYRGSFATTGDSASHGDNHLSISNGDDITVTYIDADNGSGGINVSKTAEATADCAAPTFAGLTEALPGDYQVTLNWSAATDVNPIHYNIYRADSPTTFDFGTPLATVTAVTYLDEDVVNNNTYYYVVRAEDSLNNEDSNEVVQSATPVGPERIFREDFEAADGLADWTIINAGSCNGTWTDTNPGGESSPYWSGTFAIADRTAYLFGQMDESMISPAIDCTNYGTIQVAFSHEFEKSLFDTAEVHYSIDGGNNWVLIKKFNQSNAGDMVYDVPALDHRAEVYLRFHYVGGAMAYYWGVDDIEVRGWPEAPDDDTTDDDITDDDTTDDDIIDDDTTDDDIIDDDTTDDDITDDDVTDDDVLPTDDDTADDDVVGDDDDDDDDSGCGC